MRLRMLLKSTPFLFGVIFVCALVFRISYLNLIEFKGDEAINLYLASLPKFGQGFPPGSTVSSFGILNPPLISYLLAPITLFTADPRIVSGYIGILNAIAIAFLFVIAKKIIGTKASFTTHLLLAFSPWSIIYSRKIWAQDFLLLLFTPMLYSTYKIVHEEKKFWILYVACSCFLIQIHQPSIFFVTVLTFFLLLQKPAISVKYIFIGLIIGLIPFVPYVMYELRNQCPDCITILRASQNTTPTFNPVMILRPFQIMNNGNFNFLLGEDKMLFAKMYPIAAKASIIYFLEYVFLLFGIFIFWKRCKSVRFLLFTVVLLPLTYFVLRIVPHMHYFTILIPLLYLCMGSYFQVAFEGKASIIKYATVFACILILCASVVYVHSFFTFVKTQRYLRGDYGSTYFENARTAREYFGKAISHPEYDEIFLAHYVSKDFIYADSPGSRMLFDFNSTEKDIYKLENTLLNTPYDERLVNRLIFYYTNPKFDESVVKDLDDKRGMGQGFNVLANEVGKYYRERRK